MVEQSSTTKSEEADMDYDVFTEEELEVCQTLIELEGLILKSDFRDCWPLTWGAKKRLVWGTTKKRSSIDSGTAAVAPPPPPPPQKTTATTVVQVKVEAKSPSTPLAFSPSTESDDKSKHCHRKISKKRVIFLFFFLKKFFTQLFFLGFFLYDLLWVFYNFGEFFFLKFWQFCRQGMSY